jgi:hypothetical protein
MMLGKEQEAKSGMAKISSSIKSRLVVGYRQLRIHGGARGRDPLDPTETFLS